jgi:hypothetical protein
MVTRDEILTKAVNDCMRELYSYSQPKVEWDDFKKQCEDYSERYREWEKLDKQSRTKPIEYCGPKPYEFYYLPQEFMRRICDAYVSAYKIDSQKELTDTVEVLKNYFKEPIVDKYIDEYTDENGNWHPGYRSYDHPTNLKQRIEGLLRAKCALNSEQGEALSEDICQIVDKFFDMATEFFNWNRDLNSFNLSVYMGVSPCSNKKTVIENWKKYRGVDITIDESLYKDEYDDEYFDDCDEVCDEKEESKED